MKFGIVTGSILNVRSNPDHRMEMCNQILSGEIFKIIEYLGGWVQIESFPDNYKGWIEHNSLYRILSKEDKHQLENGNIHFLRSLRKTKPTSSKPGFWLLPGSTLFHFNPKNLEFSLGSKKFVLGEADLKSSAESSRMKIEETALSFLNAPFLWGGCSLFGIDSSGLTRVVFKINGISLPRPVYKQAETGQLVTFLEEAQTGDLAFFDNDRGEIDHVGILTGKGTVIHVSEKVKIDPIDNQGIPGPKAGNYSRELRIIKSCM